MSRVVQQDHKGVVNSAWRSPERFYLDLIGALSDVPQRSFERSVPRLWETDMSFGPS
jgi:hypothetical protein